MALRIIQIVLITYAVVVGTIIIRDFIKNREKDMSVKMQVAHYILGFVVNFFDALGIGSFAPTCAAYAGFKMIDDDRKVPGTMNAGVAIPVIFEELLFITAVEVKLTTLVPMVLCGIIGSLVGTRFQTKVSERMIQFILGLALFLGAILMLGSKLGILPGGGMAVGLVGTKLVIACICNFILGFTLCFGIGNYAPCMCIVYFLGMSPLVAFPIMMCSGAMVSPTTGILNIKAGNVNRNAIMGMAAGGVIGVAIAVYIVKSMPISVLQWLVIAVVLYSSVTMVIRASKNKAAA